MLKSQNDGSPQPRNACFESSRPKRWGHSSGWRSQDTASPHVRNRNQSPYFFWSPFWANPHLINDNPLDSNPPKSGCSFGGVAVLAEAKRRTGHGSERAGPWAPGAWRTMRTPSAGSVRPPSVIMRACMRTDARTCRHTDTAYGRTDGLTGGRTDGRAGGRTDG